MLIGKDTRLSGYMFEAALESGLIAAGANVRLLGPMPTPAVAYLTREAGASGGIVISASHNPHEDNGIKFFSAAGEKLDDALEAAIEAEIEAEFRTVAPERLGKATRMTDAPQRYLGFCRSTVPAGFSLDGLKLVLDCAHGANYELGPRLLRALGAVVHALGCEPDGLNINRGVGSTHPETLAQAVRETGAAIGIAFDGDGDRVVMADARGRVVDGDDLLYVLARDWQASGRLRGPVVGTLMTNFGIESALAALGVPFHRARVGDRYVHQMLIERGGVLGGEASGHILCLDRATTGDALVNALQVLEVMQRQGATPGRPVRGTAPLSAAHDQRAGRDRRAPGGASGRDRRPRGDRAGTRRPRARGAAAIGHRTGGPGHGRGRGRGPGRAAGPAAGRGRRIGRLSAA